MMSNAKGYYITYNHINCFMSYFDTIVASTEDNSQAKIVVIIDIDNHFEGIERKGFAYTYQCY